MGSEFWEDSFFLVIQISFIIQFGFFEHEKNTTCVRRTFKPSVTPAEAGNARQSEQRLHMPTKQEGANSQVQAWSDRYLCVGAMFCVYVLSKVQKSDA